MLYLPSAKDYARCIGIPSDLTNTWLHTAFPRHLHLFCLPPDQGTASVVALKIPPTQRTVHGFPRLIQSTIPTREMPDASQTTPLIHDDPEGLYPVPQKNPLLPSVFSWLTSVVRWNPLVAATGFCMVLIGGTAGVVHWSYNRDMTGGANIIPSAYNKSGVSPFCLTDPSLV